jgi:hypothetical protein
MRIRCITLYDVTKTGISSRRKLLDHLPSDDRLRKQQNNFETLLQIIGLRCQPEDITTPVMVEVDQTLWGTTYDISKKITAWQFEFTVDNGAIYHQDNDQLFHLINDCVGVPMIIQLDEAIHLPNTIDITPQYKNIHFEVIQ